MQTECMNQEINLDINQKLNVGLTGRQVEQKTAEGLVNGEIDVKTKSYSRIIKDNLFSLFNLVNVILVACIIYVGSWKNALFFLVVIWNFLIGTIQEIRAKRTIEKLSLLSAPKAHVLRDGKIEDIALKDIVLGEIMVLRNGNQVCADCVVLDGECQVNESLITGESTPILKQKGDHLLSGSFLVSGKVKAETENIGQDNYVTKITLGAKFYKKSGSVIMNSVKMIVRVVAIAIIPLAGLFVWNNFFRVDQPFDEAMVHTVAAISAMIPGGLVLLVSMVLAVSVVRLAVHKTLVQDLYCVENLARIDVLCLDKTGTITEGKMSVENIVSVFENEDVSKMETVRKEIETFAGNMDDDNSTINAIREYFGISAYDMAENVKSNAENIITVPFSSERKWSLLYLKDKKRTYIMGAPEFVISESGKLFGNRLEEYKLEAKRVVMFACSENKPEGMTLPADIKPLAFIVIGDRIRENARETLEYFRQEDVLLKVISGDDPLTVSNIAKEAGLLNADKYIDAAELDSFEKIEAAVEKYTIFGRVTPYQKLDIVKALKNHGHSVAMTGDGANDVLALKEADCSIAMQSGAEAARNVANMVLLDSNFASLPIVVAEGRKSINNLQRSASLYLTKTTYAFIMAILFIFTVSIHYPFESIQVTLIGGMTIGIPSFFLALEPNNERIKSHFLFNVFKVAIPTGVMTLAAILITVLYAKNNLGAEMIQYSTIATYVALIVGFITIFNICGKLTLWKGALIAVVSVISLIACIFYKSLFSLTALTGQMWIVIIITVAVYFVVHGFIFRVLVPRAEAKRDAREKEQRYSA